MSDIDLKGKKVILFDDMIDSGGSTIKASENLKKEGVGDIYACSPHAIMSGDAKERLKKAGLKVIVSNSIPIFDKKKYKNIEVISLGIMGAEAIYGLITGEGLTQNLFVYENYKKLVKDLL